MNKHIEIEFRSLLDENKYNELLRVLKDKARDLGEDDKDVYFFIMPDRLLKVTDNVSQGTAKITIKLTRIGQGSDFEEIEYLIDPQDIQKAVKLFRLLDVTDEVQHAFQKRHNFEYKDVELAIKHSDAWGYHAELEIMIGDQRDKASAEEKIKKVAEELGLQLMNEEELRAFTEQKDKEYEKRQGG